MQLRKKVNYMSEELIRNINKGVKKEQKNVGGVQVKTYTLEDQNSTVFKVYTEKEIEDKIYEYDKKKHLEEEKRFMERQKKTADQMKAEMFAEMEDAGFDFGDVSSEGNSVMLDPENIATKMKTIVKDDRIVCIGDSVTYGYMVEGSLTWIGRLRREEEINLLNVGLNGDTTEGMFMRFNEHVIDLNPKACLIMGGGNDIIGGVPLEIVTNNIAMMCQRALEKGIVPMIGIVPTPEHKKVPEQWKGFIDYDQVKENLAIFKEWLITFSKANNLPYIDFDTNMKEKLRAGYSRYFMDGAHPNPAGHRMMAAIAKEAFIEMGILKPKEKPDMADKFSL